MGSTGVDMQGGCTLVWEGLDRGGIASLTFGLAGNTGETLQITCEKGSICVDAPAHAPTKMSIIDRTEDPSARPGSGNVPHEVFEEPLKLLPYHAWAEPRPALSYPHGEGMTYEARHVEECLAQGLLESPLYTLNDTLLVAQIMHTCLQQISAEP